MVVQFNTVVLEETLTVGAVIFCVITVAALVAEHPFDAVVPVTV